MPKTVKTHHGPSDGFRPDNSPHPKAPSGRATVTAAGSDWEQSDYQEGAPGLDDDERDAIAASRKEVDETLLKTVSRDIHELLAKLEILCRWMQETSPRAWRPVGDEGERDDDLFEDRLRISILRDLRHLCLPALNGEPIG